MVVEKVGENDSRWVNGRGIGSESGRRRGEVSSVTVTSYPPTMLTAREEADAAER